MKINGYRVDFSDSPDFTDNTFFYFKTWEQMLEHITFCFKNNVFLKPCMRVLEMELFECEKDGELREDKECHDVFDKEGDIYGR